MKNVWKDARKDASCFDAMSFHVSEVNKIAFSTWINILDRNWKRNQELNLTKPKLWTGTLGCVIENIVFYYKKRENVYKLILLSTF